MQHGLRKGDLVTAHAEGRVREMVFEHVTAGGVLAQCFWKDGARRRFVTLRLPIVSPPDVVRPDSESSGRR